MTHPTPSQRALEEAREVLASLMRHTDEVTVDCASCVALVAHRMDRLIAQVRQETVEACAMALEARYAKLRPVSIGPLKWMRDSTLILEHEQKLHDILAELGVVAIRALLSPPPAEEIPQS